MEVDPPVEVSNIREGWREEGEMEGRGRGGTEGGRREGGRDMQRREDSSSNSRNAINYLLCHVMHRTCPPGSSCSTCM